ncbi:uncharacterized protein Z520_07116 [Fonsecaea multimorphosa CBS 102226]|uniref:DUF7702 domain-containing protein n=1 Tax=Fonsecaea multimorphosa CBS 102226 TaxID=1442371 RepID=A0A0D2JU30_9EURO|nr:uncharacterized protein Z520_07116 [Fonsecaea multimorphosa CBS 102226]KIX97002.1 hypothetical protein Z520_07116 [Fonsecaea multimorphosa CBS 102226]
MLDSHGKLSIVEIAVYTPTAFFCLFNTIRYGFRRDAGWIYLLLFCIIKLTGAGMNIDIELGKKENLVTTATILNTIALSPLLSATLSFVNGGASKTSNEVRKSWSNSSLPRLLKPVHLLIVVALVLSISGSLDRTKTDQNDLNTGATLLKLATLLFFIVWAILCLCSLIFWSTRSQYVPMQRTLLAAVLLALPFLLVRIIYSGLNAINLNTSKSTGHTGKFNPVTGSWALYLVLGLGPEVIVVALYTTAGVLNYFKTKRGDRKGDYTGLELGHTMVTTQALGR